MGLVKMVDNWELGRGINEFFLKPGGLRHYEDTHQLHYIMR